MMPKSCDKELSELPSYYRSAALTECVRGHETNLGTRYYDIIYERASIVHSERAT